MRRTAVLILLLTLALPATAAADHRLRWQPVPTGSDQRYRGLDAVDKRVAWVGGSAGEVLRTGSDVSSDGARSWKAFDTAPYDAVDCVPGTCWASGPAGAVAVLAR